MYLLIVGVAIVIAAIYGVGHDQVTYTISPEYYTKYKFIQFNLADSGAAQHMTQPRSAVVMVGVKASWWMGGIIGAILGFFALVLFRADDLFRRTMQALGLTLLVALLGGAIGWYYGKNILAKQGVLWWIPSNVTNKPAFITAGTIHDASYLGAAIGLLAGIIFLLIKKIKPKYRSASTSYTDAA
jgi:hypothetical protein